MNIETMAALSNDLYHRWEEYRKSNPKIRIRDAAKALGVTEAQLVAVRCGDTNTRLRNDFVDIFNQLASFGELLAITRNDFVVHETRGQYSEMKKKGNVGMFFLPGLDTRFFFDNWSSTFAVNENERLSIQFFDRYGIAAHKVYMTDETDMAQYHALVGKFRFEEQFVSEPVEPLVKKFKPKVIDISRLRKAWSEIRDVHEGSRIISSLAGGDHQLAYRSLTDEYSVQLKTEVIEALLTTIAERNQQLMIFVMAKSSVQSFGGSIHKILRARPWFNILDEKFNLHLKTEGVDAVWLIRKPSKNGWITSLDVFDAEGNQLMVVCDNRSRCMAESETWTETLLEVADKFHLNKSK